MATSSEALTRGESVPNAPAAGAPRDDDAQDVAIRVRGLGKAYKVYDGKRDLMLELLTGRARHRDVWALKDVSFDVKRGSVTGVIGANGSGKSTLLKIVTGLLDASAGTVDVKGRVSAILELGTGFHPDFTGRENIITGGMCLGMSRDEVEAKVPWIIAFSELGEVIDQPFRTYSSGMQARLTFSTAIAVDPEVLVIDEALAAGDAYFVAKCFRRVREICDSGATVLFVSHSTGQVAQLCDNAIWIDKGVLREVGPAREVTRRYDYSVHQHVSNKLGRIVDIDVSAQSANGDALRAQGDDAGPSDRVPVFRRGPVFIDKVTFVNAQGEPETMFRTWDPFAIRIDYHLEGETPAHELGVGVGIERDRDLLLVAQFSTIQPCGHLQQDQDTSASLGAARRRGTMVIDLGELQLLEGDYLLSLGLLPNVPGHVDFYEYHHRVYRFRVIPAGYQSGAVMYPRVRYANIERMEPDT